MIVLAVDTATDDPAVALGTDHEVLVERVPWRAAFRATVPAVEQLLARSGLTLESIQAYAVPSGPGSFTGLRIGASVALGLARGTDRPLCALPTLEAVAEARAADGLERVCATIDARRGRVYAAVYRRSASGTRWCIERGPVDLEPAHLAMYADGSPVVGLADAGSGPTVAEALATLVARAPGAHRLKRAAALELVYARPGADR